MTRFGFSSNKINNKFIKILSIICLAVLIQLLIGSCKTCKCPAYSQIEYQNPINIEDATVKTVDFS